MREPNAGESPAVARVLPHEAHRSLLIAGKGQRVVHARDLVDKCDC